jgi:hypothetical protein
MAGIFISYRRQDSADICGRIYDHLVARYGKAAVFKDVDSIPFGESFPEYIQQTLAKCSVCLVVIGPRWLESADSEGQRRLDNPGDFVRTEIETALRLGLVVFPVLVGGGHVPPTEALPDSLAKLHTLNAAQVRLDPDFATDVRRLSEVIDRFVPSQAARPLSAVRQSGTDVLVLGGGIGLVSLILLLLAGSAAGSADYGMQVSLTWIAVLVNLISLPLGGYAIGRRNGSRLPQLALGAVAGLSVSVGALFIDAQTLQAQLQSCLATATSAYQQTCYTLYPSPFDSWMFIVILILFAATVILAGIGGGIGRDAAAGAARRARRAAARAAGQQSTASAAGAAGASAKPKKRRLHPIVAILLASLVVLVVALPVFVVRYNAPADTMRQFWQAVVDANDPDASDHATAAQTAWQFFCPDVQAKVSESQLQAYYGANYQQGKDFDTYNQTYRIIDETLTEAHVRLGGSYTYTSISTGQSQTYTWDPNASANVIALSASGSTWCVTQDALPTSLR